MEPKTTSVYQYDKKNTIIDINGKDITKRKPSTYKCLSNQKNRKEIVKGVWRMPRLSEATKDVVSCEKLRGLAHTN